MRNSAENSPPSLLQGKLVFLDFFFRLFAMPLCVASLWLMASNRQVVDTYGKMEYRDLTGLKYLVWVNALSVGYVIFAVVSSCFRWLTNAWVFFVSDQVIAYLLVTSGSAVAEVLYLAYNGDRDVSWSEACDYYGKFCGKAKLSLIFHFLASGCFMALSLISAYRVFGNFGVPFDLSSPEEGPEQVD
uniref:CASP-like protein n=1 Tax=Anthurium amnicola TaxID=1678845 RepID=A0A1D1Z9Q8_9ARAE